MNMLRRQFLAQSGAAAIAPFGAPRGAFAHDATSLIGAWSPMADMPFPVQEIYPAPFWKRTSEGAAGAKVAFNIVVNAGGLTTSGRYNVSDAVTYYDPIENQWGAGPRLPEARHHIALVNNNGFLMAIGGFARNAGGGWQMRENVWRLDTLDGSWVAVKKLPFPQAEAVCTSVRGYVHIVGGRSPSGSMNREWRDHIDTDRHIAYDPVADRWDDFAPLPTPRNSAAGAVVNNTLYVLGGRMVDDGETNIVEVYDQLADRWEKARPMPTALAGHAAAVLNGKIYVFGGEYFSASGGGVFAQSWEYDPRKDTWRSVAAMTRPRHGLGAVTMNGAIYVMGGAALPGGQATSSALDRFEI